MQKNTKRIFTPASFIDNAIQLIANLPEAIKYRQKPSIGPEFAEKLRLAVTGVNECRYCSYGHSRMALKLGVNRDEISTLLAGSIPQHLAPHEIPALLYAQHFAEQAGTTDPEMDKMLRETYGSRGAEEIRLYIREIDFGNLTGNTLDYILQSIKNIYYRFGGKLSG